MSGSCPVDFSVQGEQAGERDVQTEHLQLSCHILQCFSIQLPQEVSLFEAASLCDAEPTLKIRLKLTSMTIHTLFNLFCQVIAGNLPLIPARPVVWATALPDPIQRLGPGVWPNSVVDGSVLLPPAAFDWNCHADSHILHQKGTLEHGQSVMHVHLESRAYEKIILCSHPCLCLPPSLSSSWS